MPHKISIFDLMILPWEEFDVLKGLTYKAFGMDYNSTKEHLFEYLKELTEQIKYMIF